MRYCISRRLQWHYCVHCIHLCCMCKVLISQKVTVVMSGRACLVGATWLCGRIRLCDLGSWPCSVFLECSCRVAQLHSRFGEATWTAAVPCLQLTFTASRQYSRQLGLYHLPSLPPLLCHLFHHYTITPSTTSPFPASLLWWLRHMHLAQFGDPYKLILCPGSTSQYSPYYKFVPKLCVKWKIFYPKIYSMFCADSESLSDVDNFPPLHSLIKKVSHYEAWQECRKFSPRKWAIDRKNQNELEQGHG